MSLDVVVVTFDTLAMTQRCLAAIDEGEAVVVDNASTDGTADALDVIRVEPPGLGFAAACNLGARAGTGEYVLFLNSDIVCRPGAIATLRDALAADPDAVAAGGRLVDPGTGTTQPAYRPRTLPSAATLVVQLLGVEERWPSNPVSRRHLGAAADDVTTVAVAQPAAAALLVRRSVFARIGGFDERFWFWFEDSDLLARLGREGRVLYVPRAAFEHLGGGTFARWDKPQRIRSLHHGMLHYADTQLARGARATVGLVAVAVSAPRIAAFGRSRPAEAAAWRDVARAGRALVRGARVPALAGPGA